MSSSYSDYARIYIICLKEGNQDDILTIVPNKSTGGYKVTFRQNTVNNQYDGTLQNADLLPYLSRFFRTILVDQEAYTCLQIDCPGFPSTIVLTGNLATYLDVLNVQISLLQEDWPHEDSGILYQPTSVPNHNQSATIVCTFQNKTNPDDVLSITPANNGYWIHMDQANIRNNTTFFLPSHLLEVYLQCVFYALAWDNVPPETIQIDMPMLPTVLTNRTAVWNYIPLIFEQISAIRSRWPMETRV